MASKLSVFMGSLAVVAISTSLYLHLELQSERERSAALDRRIGELESAQHSLAPSPFVRSEATLPAEESALEHAPAAIAKVDNPPPAPSGDRLRNGFRGRPNDPEVRAMLRTQQKRRLMEMYPDLAATLRLRPDEIDKLFNLLADQQIKSMDARDALREKNLPREEFAKEMRQAAAAQNTERDKQIATLLGDRKMQEWKDYQDSLGARTEIRELKTILESSGMPLRDDQIQPLIAALAAEQSRSGTERPSETSANNSAPGGTNGRAGTVDPVQRLALLEQNVARQEQQAQRSHDALAPYLTTEQIRHYDELNSQQLDNQRMNLQRMRERIANGVSEPRRK